jgi:hypothetical protein
VVEVRDRNNQPVAGVVVTFTIQGGSNATFAGASTVTATTNALGQAAVTSMTPTGVGGVHINVVAAFQGQTATTAITQTNFATAAQAASSGASGAASGAAAGGGGAGGGIGAGTITALTVGAVGAAGGLYAYRELQKGDAPTMEGMTAFPPSGLAAVTPIGVNPGGMTWHEEDGQIATLTTDFGDGTTVSSPATPTGAPFAASHIYQSPGTYTVRITITDAWDRSASQQGSVTIKSLTGRWNVGTTAAYFTLTQQGTALSGSYTATTADSCGSLTGSVSPMVLGNNFSGNVTWSVTAPCPDFNSSFVGSTSFGTTDQIAGALTTRTGTSNVVLSRQ